MTPEPDGFVCDSALCTSAARRSVRGCLRHWHVEGLADDAALVLSELLSNALRHGEPPVRVSVTLRRTRHDGRTVHIEVADAGHTLDHGLSGSRRAHPALTMDENGRGLRLVDALSCRWGDEPTPQGHTVWADLACDAGRVT
ncbi:ATP-binding protein [Streptomyces sp. NPDC059466]|uniref:ATP-binding protein n=1 Tax=unclassified Streptomyces TaxID=2593676 RepID=UPI003699E562